MKNITGEIVQKAIDGLTDFDDLVKMVGGAQNLALLSIASKDIAERHNTNPKDMLSSAIMGFTLALYVAEQKDLRSDD